MNKRISMNKLREVFRLKFENGLSNRNIAKSCQISRRIVSEYLKLAEISGLSWPVDKNLDDTELEKKIFEHRWLITSTVSTPQKPLEDWEYVYQELKRPSVTLELLWTEYKEKYPDGYYKYRMYCLLYQQWKKKLDIYMRQNHKAGEKVFIDYGDGISITDSVTGEKIPTQLFIGVWGVSNYTYAEATVSQKLRYWIMSHVRMFEYFCCVPRICVPDNLASGVTKACRYEPDINKTYLTLAQYYGTVVIPARRNKPKDKAKVEVGVLIAKRWILACLRNRTFYSLVELNAAIRELLEKLNNRLMRKITKSRKELFETLDKPAALPLLVKPYEYAEWKKCRAGIDYCIEVDDHYYGIPYQLRREIVYVRVTDTTIEIFFRGRRVRSYIRSFEKFQHTILPEDMPESHRKYLEWTPPRIIEWAGKIGPNVAELVKQVLESRQHAEQGYRSCLGIINLKKYYPVDRVENACKRALSYKAYSYRSVKNILTAGLDKQLQLELGQKGNVSPTHENIRGEKYYKQEEGRC